MTSGGLLFTWGDGLAGKLGHGDQAPCPNPRQVMTSSNKNPPQWDKRQARNVLALAGVASHCPSQAGGNPCEPARSPAESGLAICCL